jgi:hypothetical protein
MRYPQQPRGYSSTNTPMPMEYATNKTTGTLPNTGNFGEAP